MRFRKTYHAIRRGFLATKMYNKVGKEKLILLAFIASSSDLQS